MDLILLVSHPYIESIYFIMLQRPSSNRIPRSAPGHQKRFDALDWGTVPFYHADIDNDVHSLNPLDPDDARYDDDHVEDHELNAMRGLRSIEREILALKAQGFKQSEIACRIGVTQGAVSIALYRIREKLRWATRFKNTPTLEALSKALKNFQIAKMKCRIRDTMSSDTCALCVYRYMQGSSQLSLAKEYRYSQSSMRHMIRRACEFLLVEAPNIGAELRDLLAQAHHLPLGSPEYDRSHLST